MRVVIDTNVVISALLFPQSLPATVLMRVQAAHQWVVSLAMAAELGAVIVRPKFEPLGSAKERVRLVQDLLSAAHILPVVPTFHVTHPELTDEDDARVVETALQGQAHLIVSGDPHLLRLGSIPHPAVVDTVFSGPSASPRIPILSPKAALDYLNGAPGS